MLNQKLNIKMMNAALNFVSTDQPNEPTIWILHYFKKSYIFALWGLAQGGARAYARPPSDLLRGGARPRAPPLATPLHIFQKRFFDFYIIFEDLDID